MLQQLLAPPLPSSLDTGAEAFARNRADMLEHLEVIDELLDEAEAGGGPEAMDRMRSRDKMPIRERIGHVLDPDSPFLEISPLAGYDSSYTVGGGFVVGIGVIAGVECVIVGNDPTVLGGAMTPYMAKKWMRAIEIARHNRMPYVSFVESAGADLRVQTGDGEGNPAPGQDGPLRRDRPLLLRDDRALQAGHPHRLRGLRLVHGRRRLPAGNVRLQHLHQGAVQGLPGRTTPGEDGHRRGLRRRVPGRRRDARREVRAGGLPGRGRDGRPAHVPRGGLPPRLAQGRSRTVVRGRRASA